MNPMIIALWFFVLYVIAGGIYFGIASYVEERRGHKQVKAELVQTKQELSEAQKTVEECDNYIQDLENAEGESHTDYSVMALAIEELQTQVEALIKHTAEHCGQLVQLGTIHIRIMNNAQPDYSYCGPDEYENDVDPYPEPTETPLPDWIKNVEGLDAL